ncbi:hypothetical protein C8J57DRAFT_1216456 [Mycena rebaudengoi]|jgi:hypothetical protein|nr:hypothetical protein C8J57DRAFT_1216456 [Mycena rebaudengoi]
MSTYKTVSISAAAPEDEAQQSKRHSIASSEVCSSEGASIIITTTVTTSTVSFPASVPPPFAPSLGSDERLPRPKRGAPPVKPLGQLKQKKGLVLKLRRAIGLERRRLDPALCEEWN